MRINKKGFTLAEVLVSMTIIGIIMAMSVQTIKIVKASYSSLAFFELKNMQQIAGELIGGISGKTVNGIKDITVRKEINGKSRILLTDDDDKFCNYIVAISNVAGKTGCGPIYKAKMVTWRPNPDDNTISYIEPRIEALDVKNAKNVEATFVLANGKKYYISEWTKNTNISAHMGFRVIAVDLNGTRNPNIIDGSYLGSKVPDIISFMILDNGAVYPLGVAADNLRTDYKDPQSNKTKVKMVTYIIAKVKGYYFSSPNATVKTQRVDNETMPIECRSKHISFKIGNTTFEPKDSSGTKNLTMCDFGVFDIENELNYNGIVHSYRQAYCHALGTKKGSTTGEPDISALDYPKYCDGIKYPNNICPPSTHEKRVDECRVTPIKPAFRYNL